MSDYLKKVATSILDDVVPFIEQKTKLFFGMFLASNSAAIAIYASINLANFKPDYFECLGFFLAVRVFLFMASPTMPLTDRNVAFMSRGAYPVECCNHSSESIVNLCEIIDKLDDELTTTGKPLPFLMALEHVFYYAFLRCDQENFRPLIRVVNYAGPDRRIKQKQQ